ncbi:MAG: hypothetical protein K6B70_06575 [Clostridia bacterium]|nr:hypothetical protein [Clostridia bacterium]
MDKYEKYKNEKNRHYIQRLDGNSDIKRKYKLIIEEVYKYETDSPFDIARVIDGYVNYT